MRTLRAALAALVAAGVVGIAPPAPTPAAEQVAGCSDDAQSPAEGYWIAGPLSGAREQALAIADGLFADGLNDEVQFQRATELAAVTCSKRKVNVAPGDYRFEWRDTGRVDANGRIYTAWLPRGGPSQADPIRVVAPYGGATLHAPVRPATAQNFTCGFNNRFIYVDRNVNLTLEGLVLDGHSAQQVAPSGSSRSDKRWQMDGIREHGAPGFRVDGLTVQNVRGTTGLGGCGETSGITVYSGDVLNTTVRNTDGGDQATGVHQMYGAGTSVVANSRVLGNRRIVHGFAQWAAVRPTRSGVTVRGVTSSGVRSEISTGVRDTNVVVDDVGGHAWVSNCTTDHRATGLDLDGPGQVGINLNGATDFRIERHHALGFGTDLQVLEGRPCPGGRPSQPVRGSFVGRFGYRTRTPSTYDWTKLGL